MAAGSGGGEAAALQADRWVSGLEGDGWAGGPPTPGQRRPPQRRLPNPGRRGGAGSARGGRREAGARAPTPASAPLARRAPGVPSASDAPRVPQPPAPGTGSSPRLPEERSEAEPGRPRGTISHGDAGTRPEDERRRAARALTRVGATAPGRRRCDEPASGDALAGCTRRAKRAGGAALSAVRPAPGPRRPEDGRRRPGAAPAAAAPAPATSPASGRRPVLMYVGWAPAPGG